ncbi:hypothetical protein [Vibrio brasiliensis]|uniref:Outer membrane lipoprotein n=1 Tax=Vibrio brasiliensis LMG 20546 TaxID=945543 RepID=E8LW12_9VIBR|nr:hypothetical protein [Vibrio brasiliensis]EGA65066.1 hypothetical protein VIBR0546_08977 [Vibrio brasiliensis LMG 20546]
MKKVVLAAAILAVSGCSSLVAPLASDYLATNGETIRIAYANPEKSANCELKGQSAFNPNSQSIMGIVSLGPDDMDAEQKINSTFGEEAAALGANYINRGFAGSSSFGGVYQRSSTVEATFFYCEQLPAL